MIIYIFFFAYDIFITSLMTIFFYSCHLNIPLVFSLLIFSHWHSFFLHNYITIPRVSMQICHCLCFLPLHLPPSHPHSYPPHLQIPCFILFSSSASYNSFSYIFPFTNRSFSSLSLSLSLSLLPLSHCTHSFSFALVNREGSTAALHAVFSTTQIMSCLLTFDFVSTAFRIFFIRLLWLPYWFRDSLFYFSVLWTKMRRAAQQWMETRRAGLWFVCPNRCIITIVILFMV